MNQYVGGGAGFVRDDLHHTISPLKLRYFRAPYLHDGATREIKEQLQSFLMQHGYQEAPVTLDDNDWMFAAPYSRALKRTTLYSPATNPIGSETHMSVARAVLDSSLGANERQVDSTGT